MDKLLLQFNNTNINLIHNYHINTLLSKIYHFMINNNLDEIVIYDKLRDKVYLIDSIEFPENESDLEVYPVAYSCIENFIEDDDNFSELTKIIINDEIIQHHKIINFIIETNDNNNTIKFEFENVKELDNELKELKEINDKLTKEISVSLQKQCSVCKEFGHYKGSKKCPNKIK